MTLRGAFMVAAKRLFVEHGAVANGQERPWGKLLREALLEDAAVGEAHADYQDGDRAWGHWTRRPGPIDLVWKIRSDAWGAVELKIRKPDELAWDLIKLADQTFASDRAAFQFAAICVELDPVDLRRGSGALLAEDHTGTQRPVEWIERWPRDWLSLMCGGRGIRPTSLPSAVVLQPAVIVGDPAVTHWVIRQVTCATDGGLMSRDVLDAWGWPSILGARPAGWAEKVKASDGRRSATGPGPSLEV